MRVIALVSLALALAASSMPLSSRTNDVSTTGDRSVGNIGAAGSASGKATYKSTGSPGSVSEDGSTGSFGSGEAVGSGTASGLESGTLGGRSNDPKHYAYLNKLKELSEEELKMLRDKKAGQIISAINRLHIKRGTPLRSRTTTESARGVGTIADKVTGDSAASGASKIAQGKNIPSGAEGTAKGAAGGAAGSLTGSGPRTQTGNAPV